MAKAVFIGDLIEEDDQDALNKHVFGHNHKTDDDGNPIEQGLGSIAHMKSGLNQSALENHFRCLGNPKHGGSPEKEAAARKEYADKFKAVADKNRDKARAAIAKRKAKRTERFEDADLLDL